MDEIKFSRWLFEGRPRQGKNMLPDWLTWLCYFAGSSKSHRENSIFFIFLESPHQVDMKNVVKCYKQFFCYCNALKTHSDLLLLFYVILKPVFPFGQEKDATSADSTKIQFSQLDETYRNRMLHQKMLLKLELF